MLTGGVGEEAPRAGGPSSPKLRPPLQGERERERSGAVNSARKPER